MSMPTWTERETFFDVIALTICCSATRFSPPRPMSTPRSVPSTSRPSVFDCSPYTISASMFMLASRSLSTLAPSASSSA
ncbi:MAG: hypothetical protein AUH85_13295 [Chloroflexi bacterium 13_1_40CM_4_68_4]|nr:MAG: hypothetical protein AUH85_13295 [Chloroflexi bacterium 13_1_40CM_4_68_4]